LDRIYPIVFSVDSLIAIPIGFLYSIVIGHCCTSKIVNELWKPLLQQDKDTRPFSYTPRIVGHVERTLYFFAIFSGFEEFIAVWLALKAAGKWVVWEKGTTTNNEEKKKDTGRAFYNVFLIGSGLSVGYAFVGVNLVHLLLDEKYWISLIAPAALIIGCWLLYLVILKEQEKDKTKNDKSGPIEKTNGVEQN